MADQHVKFAGIDSIRNRRPFHPSTGGQAERALPPGRRADARLRFERV